MKPIKILKNKKRKQNVAYDPKKESIIRELAELAQINGISVKREVLKQGIGWKVMSGSCRFNDERIIFVDRKLSQSDQISFLFNKFMNLGLRPDAEQIQKLSDDTRSMFSAVA